VLQSFRTQIAWLFGLAAMAMAALITVVTTTLLSAHVAKDQGEALQALAQSTSVMLGEGLHERLREIELLADSFEMPGEIADTQRVDRALALAQATRTQYSWIGLTTPQGLVRNATKNMLLNKDVSARPWFQQALKGSHVGDVHEAKLLAKMLPRSETGEPLRFVDFAAPVQGPDGKLIGVLGAHANWDWIREVINTLRSDRAHNQGVMVFILNKDGVVIQRPVGPEGLIEPAKGTRWPNAPGIVAWSDGKRYLSATARIAHGDTRTQLGWTIVVRQPESLALAAASQVRKTMAWLGAVASILAMAVAWFAADRLSRPLHRLSTAASRIKQGELDVSLPPLESNRELKELSDSLRDMTQSLQQGRQQLAEVNASLEEKVRERTNELERANIELANLARKDGLTGLFNRRAAEDRMDEEFARHRRNGHTLSMLVLDIDHFKRINDTFGHAAGDEALRRVASCLDRTCRGSDFVARIGGEEFLVLLPETSLDGAMQVGEKLRQAVAELDVPEVGHLTVSVGTAEMPAHGGVAIRDVLKLSDEALYAAKTGGRNRVVGAPQAPVSLHEAPSPSLAASPASEPHPATSATAPATASAPKPALQL
jgi:diguanylate cyclase (GGDEF)-like protein